MISRKGAECAGFSLAICFLLAITTEVCGEDSQQQAEHAQITQEHKIELEKVKNEAADLRARLSSSEASRASLERETRQLDAQLASANAQVDTQRAAQEKLQADLKDLQDQLLQKGVEFSEQRTALLTRTEEMRLSHDKLQQQHQIQVERVLDLERKVAEQGTALLEKERSLQELHNTSLHTQFNQAWAVAEAKLEGLVAALNATNTTQLKHKVADVVLATQATLSDKSSQIIKAAGPHVEAAATQTAETLSSLKDATVKHTAELASQSKEYVDAVLTSPNVEAAKRTYAEAIDELIVLTVDILSKSEITKAYANQQIGEFIVKGMLLLPLLLISLLWLSTRGGTKKDTSGHENNGTQHRKQSKHHKGKKQGGVKQRGQVITEFGDRVQMP